MTHDDEKKINPPDNPSALVDWVNGLSADHDWGRHWEPIYQAIVEALATYHQNGADWAGARDWFKTLRFEPAYCLANQMLFSPPASEADRQRAWFAARYLAQMRPRAIYYSQYIRPLMAELPPDLRPETQGPAPAAPEPDWGPVINLGGSPPASLFPALRTPDPASLSPAVLRRLKEAEPVGCRDWASVHLLRCFGVESYFSPDPARTAPGGPNPAEEGPPYNSELEGYEDFGPAQAAVEEEALALRKAAVRAWLEQGLEPPEIIARWREMCRPEAQAAARIFAEAGPLPAPSLDLAATAASLRRESLARGEAGPLSRELALALDENLAGQLPVVLESIIAHTAGPLRFNILLRGLSADYAEAVAAFGRARGGARLAFRFFFCDRVNYADRLNLFKHITVSTLDRLLLPALVLESDRLLYLDLDILAADDLEPLLNLDLGPAPLAAMPEEDEEASRGGSLWSRRRWPGPARELYPARLRLLADLKARSGGEGPANLLDFPYVNAGVLLFNLDLWRREKLDQLALALVEHFRLNDQDAINLALGARIKPLPIRYNHMTTIQYLRDPVIIHWPGPLKPWRGFYVPHKEKWDQAARRAAGFWPASNWFPGAGR